MDSELNDLISICQERSLSSRDIYAVVGKPVPEMCVFHQGPMEINIMARRLSTLPKAIIQLGKGQWIRIFPLPLGLKKQPAQVFPVLVTLFVEFNRLLLAARDRMFHPFVCKGH